MAYLLNSVNLTTYGINAGQVLGSNISLSGCFDMPERIGDLYKDWGDESGIQPYVDADELFYSGRDIIFAGFIIASVTQTNTYLQSLYNAINAFTGLVTFSTPYGNYSVQVKSVTPIVNNIGCSLTIIFRQPIVPLTGGSLPAVGSGSHTVDNIPLSSFGLYYTRGANQFTLPELKEQIFTRYGSEGYQIVKHQVNIFEFEGFIAGNSLSDFQTKLSNCYYLFSQSGMRDFYLNGKHIICFAHSGFKISNVILSDGLFIGNFKMDLMCALAFGMDQFDTNTLSIANEVKPTLKEGLNNITISGVITDSSRALGALMEMNCSILKDGNFIYSEGVTFNNGQSTGDIDFVDVDIDPNSYYNIYWSYA